MLKIIRQHILFRFFWGFMAFLILNCSVDTPDAMPESVAEDLSYNDMESVIEIVIEQVLGFENAIVEYDDNDSEDGLGFNLKKTLDFYIIPILQIKIAPKKVLPIEIPVLVLGIDDYFDQSANAPPVPPPQV
jgi:hypothetical protein